MGKKDQEEEDKAEDAEDHTDMEMKGCKSDGTECELDSADGSTMTCHTVRNPPAGFVTNGMHEYYMAKDLVTCTKNKADAATDTGYSGSDWTGLTNAPTPAPEAKTEECKELEAKWAAGRFAGKNTASGVACDKNADWETRHAGLLAFFDMKAACPVVCDEGTDVHVHEVNGD